MGGLLSTSDTNPEETPLDAFQTLVSLKELLKKETHNSEVLQWGSSNRHALGMGKVTDFRFPVVNPFLIGLQVRKVHTSTFHSFISTYDNRLYSFGCNQYGQCGVGREELQITVPTEVKKFRGKEIVLFASGVFHSHFVTSNNNLYSVGCNTFGQLGNSSFSSQTVPIRIDLPDPSDKIRLLSCGDFFTIMMTESDDAYGWGRNHFGQTGSAPSNSVRSPECCGPLHKKMDVVSIACGSDHTIILDESGDVFQWGSNRMKQFGALLTTNFTLSPKKIPIDEHVHFIQASGNTSAAVTEKGNLWIWGAKSRLHRPTRNGVFEHPAPVNFKMQTQSQILKFTMGRYHLHILTRAGELYTWVFGNPKKFHAPFLLESYKTRFEEAKLNTNLTIEEIEEHKKKDWFYMKHENIQEGNPRTMRTTMSTTEPSTTTSIEMPSSTSIAAPSSTINNAANSLFQKNYGQIDPGYVSEETDSEADDIPSEDDYSSIESSESDGSIDSDDDEDSEDGTDERGRSNSRSDDSSEMQENRQEARQQREERPPRANNRRQQREETRPNRTRDIVDSSENSSETIVDANVVEHNDEEATAVEMNVVDNQPKNLRELQFKLPTPKTPWLSYQCGPGVIKDITCGGFFTSILMFPSNFTAEFSKLFTSPTEYFADYSLNLSSGQSFDVHYFFVKARCPRLVAKKREKTGKKRTCYATLVEQSNPKLIQIILKNIYYSYSSLSHLNDEELVELKKLVSTLQYTSTDLYSSITQEINYRSKESNSADLSAQMIEASMLCFKTNLKAMYEAKIRTDFVLVAVGDGSLPLQAPQSFGVHRCILAARSPFYEALFDSRMSESIEKEHHVKCDANILDQFLRFCYYDFMDFTLEAAIWMLKNMAMIFVDAPRTSLQKKCENILIEYGRFVELKASREWLPQNYWFETNTDDIDFNDHPITDNIEHDGEVTQVDTVKEIETTSTTKTRPKDRSKRAKKTSKKRAKDESKTVEDAVEDVVEVIVENPEE